LQASDPQAAGKMQAATWLTNCKQTLKQLQHQARVELGAGDDAGDDQGGTASALPAARFHGGRLAKPPTQLQQSSKRTAIERSARKKQKKPRATDSAEDGAQMMDVDGKSAAAPAGPSLPPRLTKAQRQEATGVVPNVHHKTVGSGSRELRERAAMYVEASFRQHLRDATNDPR